VRFVDALCLFLLTLSAATICFHKYHGQKMAFLFQPCHVLHAFLIYTMTLPRGSKKGAICLGIYLCNLSAPFLGTVAVDLSCYTQRFEALNWGVQHISMMLVPLWLVASQRFGPRPLGGLALFGTAFTAQCILHFPFLVIFSVLSSSNLNYVLCPPQGQQILVDLDWMYRPPMFFFCAVLAASLRFGLVAGWVKLVCPAESNLKETSKVTPDDQQTVQPSREAASLDQEPDASPRRREGLRSRDGKAGSTKK